ncbi:response regulator [Bradyrhizobium sp. URHA0013]|uniref:phosphorylase family protein n=1 Tax=Bradyrhizobium sp. URHA0013 TaxID=1380352 RepID=UPI000485F0D4|nr:response regulator [Bradyrhizobium sp. URHA0013]
MAIVVFEDDENKWAVIRDSLRAKGIKENGIKRIGNIAQFAQLAGKPIDLCIIDIRMPAVSGGETRSAGLELLKMLDYSRLQRVPVLAITAYPDEANLHQSAFASRGCIIYDYNDRQTWSQALDIFIAQSKEKGRYDFLLFTALKKERDAYLKLPRFTEDSTKREGLDLWETEIEGSAGAIVLLPRMGIINAAVTTARALELYSPSVVAMSGICAGIGDNAELGQLLIADVVWEYQSGKWIKEAFEAEPYQVSIQQDTRLTLSKLLETRGLISRLEASFSGSDRPSKLSTPKLAAFTSGSAVIASEARLEAVKGQHRKVAGIDMEVYGFHRAVELCARSIHAFSAKVVVDKANEAKGDELQEYGSFVSAAFTMEAVRLLLNETNESSGRA